MVKGLGHVVASMTWYMSLSSHMMSDSLEANGPLLKLRESLECRIVNVYCEMLRYQMKSVAHCHSGYKLSRTLKTMLKLDDWNTRIEELEKLEGELKTELSQYTGREGIDKFGNFDRTAQTVLIDLNNQFGKTNLSERSALIGQFKTSCYEQYMQLHSPPAPSTCEWLQRHRAFASWKELEVGLLFIVADAGCGKSVLARYLVQEVFPHGKPPAVVAHFFFGNSCEERSLSNALCAILHQVFLQSSDLVESCSDIIRVHGPKLLSDPVSLWSVLMAAASQSKRKIVCVLDAFSSITKAESQTLIQLFYDLLSTERSVPLPLKFVITTRKLPNDLRSLDGNDTMSIINIKQDRTYYRTFDVAPQVDLRAEINSVFEYRISKLATEKNLDQYTVGFIREALQEPSSEPRSFLYMSRMFDILDENMLDTPGIWEALFQDPPVSLFETYEALLQDVPTKDTKQVKRLFNLILAANKPLTVHDLNVALHIRDHKVAYGEKSFSIPSDDSFWGWIIAACGCFVTEFQGRVFFTHRLAERFLLRANHERVFSESGLEEHSKWEGSVTIAQAHRSMAESCIAYLSLGILSTPKFAAVTAVFNNGLRNAQMMLLDGDLHPEQFLDHAYEACRDFLEALGLSGYSLYALQHWVGHFDLAQEFDENGFSRDIEDDLQDAYCGLFDDAVPVTRPWLVMTAQTLEEDCGYRLTEFDKASGTVKCHRSIDSASLASLFGHYRLVKQYLGERSSTTMPDLVVPETSPTQRGPVVDPPYSEHQPVFFAAAAGHRTCLNHILTTVEVDDARDRFQRTPLHQAARLGRYDCLEPLLKSFGIDQRDDHGWSAFDYLVHRIDGVQHVEMPRQILRAVVRAKAEKSAELSFQHSLNENCISPLSLAAKFPDETFLEQHYSPELLKDAELVNNICQSRLFQLGYESSLIKFLLDHGEDINQREIGGYTPLHFASMGNFWNAMFLLHSGADISATDDRQRTPLHLASEVASPASIALVCALLKSGASPNKRDSEGVSPFMTAVLHPYDFGDTLVDLMLQYGADLCQQYPDGYSTLYKVRWRGSRADFLENWLPDTSILWGEELIQA